MQQPYIDPEDRIPEIPSMRFSENQSNRGFAMPGGFNTNNQMFNLLGNVLLSSATGSQFNNIAPLQGYSGTDIGYINSSIREQDRIKVRGGLIAENPGLRLFGRELSESPAFQEAYSQLGGGAGNMDKAYQAAMNNFGSQSMLGYSLRDQSVGAQNMVRSLSQGYSEKDEKGNPLYYSRQKSFGFDVHESIGALDAMRRSGALGFSAENIREATAPDKDGNLPDPEKLQRLSSEANKFMRIGKQTFGEDLNFDQIADLMDKATDGLSKINGTKASELESRIQATSRALDISGKQFAAYMDVQQKMYKSMGITGEVSTNAILGSAATAQSLMQIGQKTGNRQFSDVDKALSASAKMARDYGQSESFKSSIAIMSLIGEKTKGQRASTMVGNRNMEQFAKEFSTAINSGDLDRQEALRNEIMQAGVFSQGQIETRKHADVEAVNRLTRRVGVDVGTAMNSGAGAKGVFDQFKSQVVQSDINYNGGEMSNLLAKNNVKLNDVLSDMSVADMQDPEAISKKLEKLGVTSQEERDKIASATSSAVMTQLSNTGQGYADNPAGFDLYKNQISAGASGINKLGAEAQKRTQDESTKVGILAALMGDVSSNKLSTGELITNAGKLATDAQDFAKKAGRTEANSDDYAAAAKKLGIKITDSTKLEKIKDLMSPGKGGEPSKMDQIIQEANKRAEESGVSLDEQDKIRNEYIASEVGKIDKDINAEEIKKATDAAKKAGAGGPPKPGGKPGEGAASDTPSSAGGEAASSTTDQIPSESGSEGKPESKSGATANDIKTLGDVISRGVSQLLDAINNKQLNVMTPSPSK